MIQSYAGQTASVFVCSVSNMHMDLFCEDVDTLKSTYIFLDIRIQGIAHEKAPIF